MKFEWDETKRRINFEKHGLDFRDAEKVFQGPIITAEEILVRNMERLA
jgi:uncharacterized DUF497 family protein